MNKKNFESVHYSIKNRKKYKAKLWLVFFLLLVVLAGCGVMFYFANVKNVPDGDNPTYPPVANPTNTFELVMLIGGGVIALVALVGAFLYYWFDINKFYRTQLEYQKTDSFKQQKAKALKQDLTKLSKSTIKWYKKHGYISSQEKRDILAQKKAKNK